MPQRRHRFGTTLVRLLFLAAALSLLDAAVRRERTVEVLQTSRRRRRRIRIAPRRLAASLAFATLFFAGASLSAGAGNEVAQLLEQGGGTALPAETATTTATTSTEEAADDPTHLGRPSDETSDEAAAEPSSAPLDETPAPADEADLADAPAPHNPVPATTAWKGSTPAASAQKRLRAHGKDVDHAPPLIAPRPMTLGVSAEEPEAVAPGIAATIWLHRTLPDPTPPSRRLTPAFARRLARVSGRSHVDWALLLGVLRANGKLGSAPASPAGLRGLAKRLVSSGARRSAWTGVLALEGRTAFADRTLALQRYYRAVGLSALVRGLEWAKPSLSKRLLNDPRVAINPGGRGDIQAGRVDIRVLVLIAYLAEAHGQVTVSCLISGHRLYARPGVVSAHIYGLAADISVLDGVSIAGNQQPGGITEQAVRNILLLPAELQPRQVISLLGLGGPSFPLANHDDHIHVGY